MNIFLLNSAPGVGKSTLLKHLWESSDVSGLAVLDGDNLGLVNPMEKSESWLNLIYSNIVSCAKNYSRAGIDSLVIGFVFPSKELLGDLINRLKEFAETVTVIVLFCEEEKLINRIKSRNTSKMISVETAARFNREIKASGDSSGFSIIDTTDIPPEEVNRRILLIIAGHQKSSLPAQQIVPEKKNLKYPEFIDLSHSIDNTLPCYPGVDENPRLIRTKEIRRDHYNYSKLEIGMHIGTHIDTPSHLTDDPKTVTDYPPERFIGKATLLDVRGEKIISLKDQYRRKIKESEIILFYSGYDQYLRSDPDRYFKNHPEFSEELACFLADNTIKMIGIDFPAPDKPPFPVHKILFKKDILIAENLTNLGLLRGLSGFKVFALPLKIPAEGAVARIVAQID